MVVEWQLEMMVGLMLGICWTVMEALVVADWASWCRPVVGAVIVGVVGWPVEEFLGVVLVVVALETTVVVVLLGYGVDVVAGDVVGCVSWD